MRKNNIMSSLGDLRNLSISPGAVFIGPWSGVDHEKFLIIGGVAEDRILVCTVMINSRINQYIMKRPNLLACQVELKSVDYDFLTHDSYANCAQPIKAKLELFMVDDMKYCGMLNDTDLQLVRQQIIASGTLTTEDVALFFGRT